MKIPVTALVLTRNEEARIARCLDALEDFGEVIVVDSHSTDRTVVIAAAKGAIVVPFQWNGRCPKKKQWSLDNVAARHGWILMVDADEVVTPELAAEIAALFAQPPACAGYFIGGRYVTSGRVLRFGAQNRKLALFDRRKIAFPVIDDLGLPGMGEIEGHYQPVLKPENRHEKIGALKQPLLHYAHEDEEEWLEKHRRYAAWERGMNERNAWPRDPVWWRQGLKRLFRALPGRGLIAFLHSYLLKGGFLDGAAGFRFARDRWRYYRMIGKPD